MFVELALPENLSGRAVFHPAASSIFSIKIPYPEVGSFTRTWVTAPMSLPSCKIGEPDTSDWQYGQHFLGSIRRIGERNQIAGEVPFDSDAVVWVDNYTLYQGSHHFRSKFGDLAVLANFFCCFLSLFCLFRSSIQFLKPLL